MKELYKMLFDKASDVILAIDLENGSILDVNERIEPVLGWQRKEVLGKHYREIFSHHAQELGRSYNTVVEIENFRKKDGSICTLDMTISILDWHVKQILAVFLRDVSQRRQIEEKMRKLQERANNILNSISDGVLALDKNNKILVFNRAAEIILAKQLKTGLSFEEALEKFSCEALTAHEISTLELDGKELMREDETIVLINISGYDDSNDKSTTKIAVFHDVTLQKNLERKKIISAMGVTTNHDLNQPLMILQGAVELLRLHLESCPNRMEKMDILQNIENSVFKMDEILKVYRDNPNFRLEDYTKDTLMVRFSK